MSVDLRRARERYARTVEEYGVPAHLREGLIAHVVEGRQTGGFLYQVLSDNLAGAVTRAGDDLDLAALRGMAKWLYNEAPARAWGSEEAVTRWREQGGEAGR